MATQKTWSYDEALANFNRPKANLSSFGLTPEQAVQMGVAGEGYAGNRTWEDVLRGNASDRLGPQANSMTPAQLEAYARQNGILGGKETTWGQDLVEGIKGPLALPAAFLTAGAATGAFSGAGAAGTAGGAMDMGIGGIGESMGLGGGAELSIGAAPSAADGLYTFPGESVTAGSATYPGGTMAASGAGSLLDYVPAQVKAMGGSAVGDWLKKNAGSLIAAGVGVYASNKQADSYEDLAREMMGYGAPSRGRYEASYRPGFSMMDDPGYKDALDMTTKSFLHKASVGGNPVDSPNAWNQTLMDVNSSFAYPALQEYRRMNAGSGGIAALTSAAPSASGQAIKAQGNVYDAIGAGAADIFNPPKTLEDVLRTMKVSM